MAQQEGKFAFLKELKESAVVVVVVVVVVVKCASLAPACLGFRGLGFGGV